MRHYVSFISHIYDTQFINKEPSISFFIEQFEGAPSATREVEKRLVRWLFNFNISRQLILPALDLATNTPAQFEITHPFSEREFDVLVCNPIKPQYAVAIECKRVKIKAESFEHNDVTKLEGVGKGVKQANELLKVGFYRTFLAVIIVVDGRGRTDYGMHTRGVTTQQFEKIYDFPRRDSLHNDVGVLFIEVIQTTDAPLSKTGCVAVGLDKKAIQQDQSASITNKVRSRFPLTES